MDLSYNKLNGMILEEFGNFFFMYFDFSNNFLFGYVFFIDDFLVKLEVFKFVNNKNLCYNFIIIFVKVVGVFGFWLCGVLVFVEVFEFYVFVLGFEVLVLDLGDLLVLKKKLNVVVIVFVMLGLLIVVVVIVYCCCWYWGVKVGYEWFFFYGYCL